MADYYTLSVAHKQTNPSADKLLEQNVEIFAKSFSLDRSCFLSIVMSLSVI